MFLRTHRRLGTVLVWASCSSAFLMAAGLPSARAGGGANLDLVEIETQYLTATHQRTWYEVRMSGWGPALLDNWQAVLDPGFLGVKDFGTVELANEPCCTDQHCAELFGIGATCDTTEGRCTPSFQNNDSPLWQFEPTSAIPAPYLTFAGQRAAGSPLADAGEPVYGGTIVVDIRDMALELGVGLVNSASVLWNSTETFLRDASNAAIPLIDFDATEILIPTGQCCIPAQGTCLDATTRAGCYTYANPDIEDGSWFPYLTCADGCLGCTENAACDDSNACTADRCVNDYYCVHEPQYDPRTECCLPQTGAHYGGSDAKSNPCLQIVCNDQTMTATFEPFPVGAPCDDGDPCTMHTYCDANGQCVGLPAYGPNCPKSRYLSFTTDQAAATGCAGQRAIRVTFVDLPGFAQFNGETRWLGAPGTYPDVVPGETFTGALLQCTPHFDDFASWSLMHVFGPGVIPGATYEVQTVDISCQDLNDPGCYSAPFEVHTGAWGDVAPPFKSPQYLTQPDFRDISALVDAFLGASSAPIKAQAQLQPNVPDPQNSVDFHDISDGVSAFLGEPYPYTGPNSCG